MVLAVFLLRTHFQADEAAENAEWPPPAAHRPNPTLASAEFLDRHGPGRRMGMTLSRCGPIGVTTRRLAIANPCDVIGNEPCIPPAPLFVTGLDRPAVADFPTPSLAQLWLWAGVPTMGFVALAIAAISGIGTLRRSGRTRSAGSRAMALALGLPAFPLIPIACHEARVNLDDDLIGVLAWLSVLFFAGGCVWLTRSARSIPRPPE